MSQVGKFTTLRERRVILGMLACTGAALGPLLAGLLSARGWSQVFYMLMTADFLALLVSAERSACRETPVNGSG